MRKVISPVFVIFVIIGLIVVPSSLATPVLANESAGQARWELSIDLNPELVENQEWKESFAAAYRESGMEAVTEENQLKLKGQSDSEQLRSAIFDTGEGGIDFLGGVVELIVSIAGGETLTLNMETRITAGYSWEVLPESEVKVEEGFESTFSPRYRGYGAPSIQTIKLKNTSKIEKTAQLVYRRWFEPDEPAHAKMHLWLPKGTSELEISDPTPPLLDESQSIESSDPIKELPLKEALPSSWDWRTKGVVPAVRNQGSCGSCWSFGTVGIMESAMKKAGATLPDLSEQFLISCNKDGWSCNGGLTAHKYHYNTLGLNQTTIGAVLEADKPYMATNGTCTVAYNHPYKLSGWKFITGSEWDVPTVDQIKNAIYTYGPVTGGVCVGNAFEDYSGGVFATNEDCGGSTNHQIILVGWDDATQSWILRNSWGTSWGENGYMRIKYGTSRVGEGTSWVTYSAPSSTVPATPTAYRPLADTYTIKPTYSWSRIDNATGYTLQVYDPATQKYLVSMKVGTSACSTDTNRCSYRPDVNLINNKSYQWRVLAYNDKGKSAYTKLRDFTIKPGINSKFNGSADSAWRVRPGGAWYFYNNMYWYTSGMVDKWSSVSYNTEFKNFTYKAYMKRNADGSTWATGVVVRGTPTFDADNAWENTYLFLYSQVGYFSVWKTVGGTNTPLKGWTLSSAIKKSDWNLLHVTVDGSNIRFYINNTLVWSGSDTSFAKGQVGLIMYRSTTAEKLYVDWAVLTMSDYYDATSKGNVVMAEESTDISGDPGVPEHSP